MSTMPRPQRLDRRVTLAANRWGTRSTVGAFFGVISRLGDGIFWYAVIAILAVAGGWRGMQAVSFTVVAVHYFPVLAPLLIGFTALVGASRVILGLHYPSDVIAATAIG